MTDQKLFDMQLQPWLDREAAIANDLDVYEVLMVCNAGPHDTVAASVGRSSVGFVVRRPPDQGWPRLE